MHKAVKDFVREMVHEYGPFQDVLEVGSRDVNGSIRPIFSAAQNYIALDNAPGPGVDFICDAAEMDFNQEFDCVVCCEVLEHSQKWQGILERAARALRPSGTLILTCAGPDRAPHNSRDEKSFSGEYYANLDPKELEHELNTLFFMVRVTTVGMDIQALAEFPR